MSVDYLNRVVVGLSGATAAEYEHALDLAIGVVDDGDDRDPLARLRMRLPAGDGEGKRCKQQRWQETKFHGSPIDYPQHGKFPKTDTFLPNQVTSFILI